jgi:hypothetical protein
MEKLDKGTKAIIKAMDGGSFMKSMIGQQVTADVHLGTSGETQLFNLTTGGGLFLRHDQIERV